METRVDEIAERIYRLSTFVPDIGPPASRSISSSSTPTSRPSSTPAHERCFRPFPRLSLH